MWASYVSFYCHTILCMGLLCHFCCSYCQWRIQIGLKPHCPRFLNILWKWNNLVSMRPNYFIFMGYLRQMRLNHKKRTPTPLYTWTRFPEILDPPMIVSMFVFNPSLVFVVCPVLVGNNLTKIRVSHMVLNFFMLNSTEHEIYATHKYKIANSWHFSIYQQKNYIIWEVSSKKNVYFSAFHGQFKYIHAWLSWHETAQTVDLNLWDKPKF